MGNTLFKSAENSSNESDTSFDITFDNLHDVLIPEIIQKMLDKYQVSEIKDLPESRSGMVQELKDLPEELAIIQSKKFPQEDRKALVLLGFFVVHADEIKKSYRVFDPERSLFYSQCDTFVQKMSEEKKQRAVLFYQDYNLKKNEILQKQISKSQSNNDTAVVSEQKESYKDILMRFFPPVTPSNKTAQQELQTRPKLK